MKNANTAINAKQPESNKPYTMLGAGKLTSAMWKEGDPNSGFRYRFNIYRTDAKTGHVEQIFQPDDVQSLVNLARLLGVVFLDDGWLSEQDRIRLHDLVSRLDQAFEQPDDLLD
jgi:hypothetical protein